MWSAYIRMTLFVISLIMTVEFSIFINLIKIFKSWLCCDLVVEVTLLRTQPLLLFDFFFHIEFNSLLL